MAREHSGRVKRRLAALRRRLGAELTSWAVRDVSRLQDQLDQLHGG
ncbi:MAG: hypothetical protein HN341_00805 [Verrucomicrobia bacterium]|nr:hypothetical protein [Verrucomicrobiota bacterium]